MSPEEMKPRVFQTFLIQDPLNSLNSEEKFILSEFKQSNSKLTMHKDDVKFLSDYTLYRFLKAKKWNQMDAQNQLVEAIKWRADLKPWLIEPKHFEKAGQQKFIFANGMDRSSRPILYLMMGRDKLDNSLENQLEKLKCLVYWMEKCCESMKPGATQCTFIIDLKNANISWDMIQQMKGLFGNLGTAYPERLGMCLITNVSWGLMSLWYFVQGMLPEATQAKFKLLSSDEDEMVQEMEEYVELEQLVQDFKGKSTFKP